MNPSIIVIGVDGHTTLLVGAPAPAKGTTFDCPCGKAFAVEKTVEGHTSEYNSRCLSKDSGIVDNRRTS